MSSVPSGGCLGPGVGGYHPKWQDNGGRTLTLPSTHGNCSPPAPGEISNILLNYHKHSDRNHHDVSSKIQTMI